MPTGVYGWKCRTIPLISHLRSGFFNTARMEKASPRNLQFGSANTGNVGDVASRPVVERGRVVPPPPPRNHSNIGASGIAPVAVSAKGKGSFGGPAAIKSRLTPSNGAPAFQFGSFPGPVSAERSGPSQPELPENLDHVQISDVQPLPLAAVKNVDEVDNEAAPPPHEAGVGAGESRPPPVQYVEEVISFPQLSKAPQAPPQSQQTWGAKVAKDAEPAKVVPSAKMDVPQASAAPQVTRAAPALAWGQKRPGKEKSNDAAASILVDDEFPALGAPSSGKARMPKGQPWRADYVESSKEVVVNVAPVMKEVPHPDPRREVDPHGSQWNGRESAERHNNKRGRGGGGNWQDGGRERDHIDSLARTLTRILRHQASDLKIKLRSDGYVEVKELLKLHMKSGSGRPMSSHTVEDVLLVVKQDNKQRFGTKEENGVLLIRANQGHTIKTVETEHLLKPILTAEEIPVCVHGTYLKFLTSIRKEGLKRMSRNHVHFASGLSPNEGAVSGMRRTSEVLIYLDVSKALQDGMKLYISENGVILTEGFNGVVPPKYFKEVRSWPDNKPLNIK